MEKIKNASQALKELIYKYNEHDEQPYKKIRNFYYQDFLTYFSPTHQKLILKIYVKNQILKIIARHRVAYQELNHDNTKIYIKKLIKDYVKFKPENFFSKAIIENGGIKDVRIFFKTLKIEQKRIEKEKEMNHQIELSLGKFRNHLENEELHLKFEELRTQIKTKVQNISE